jgi:hypothetical protein
MIPKSTTVSTVPDACSIAQMSRHGQRHRTAVQSSSRQLDHRVVEIEGRHSLGTEPIEDHLGADAAAATDFEHVLAGQVAARQPPEPRRLPPVLMCCPHGVVHKCTFDGVELHVADGTPAGYDPKALRLARGGSICGHAHPRTTSDLGVGDGRR